MHCRFWRRIDLTAPSAQSWWSYACHCKVAGRAILHGNFPEPSAPSRPSWCHPCQALPPWAALLGSGISFIPLFSLLKKKKIIYLFIGCAGSLLLWGLFSSCSKWELFSSCGVLPSHSEKAMAPHSSTLAWKIPWTEGPGGLQSMRSLGVGHDWATSLSLSCVGEGNGNPLQHSCLENPRDGGAWWAAIYGVTQSRTRLKRLSSSSLLIAVTSPVVEFGL